MNSRERILTALNNREPDKVPIFELLIDESSIVKLARLLMPKPIEIKAKKTMFGEEGSQILDLYCSIINELELDATTSNFSVGLEAVGEDHARDKFGTVYCLSPYGEPFPIEGAIKGSSDIKGFDMISKLVADDFTGVQYIVDKIGVNKAHFMNILDPFKLSWRLRGGMQNLLMDYVLNTEITHALARITTDFDLAAIEFIDLPAEY